MINGKKWINLILRNIQLTEILIHLSLSNSKIFPKDFVLNFPRF